MESLDNLTKGPEKDKMYIKNLPRNVLKEKIYL